MARGHDHGDRDRRTPGAPLLVAGAIAGRATLGAAIGFTGAAVYPGPGAAVLLAVRYQRVRQALSRLVLRAARRVRPLPRRRGTSAPAGPWTVRPAG